MRSGPAGVALAAALILAACASSGAGSNADPVPATPPRTTATTGTTGPADDAGTAAAAGPSTVTTAPPTTVDEVAGLVAELSVRSLPTTADTLAADLSDTEQALGDATLAPELTRARGQRQQLLYRVLSAHPEWADTVIAGIAPDVRDVVALNWEARSNLSALVRSENIAATLPAWEIRPPAPPDELLGYYREAADATGVPWEVLAAINLVETRMGRINGLSTAGAVGPMQFLPSTWAGCCTGDPTDDRDAILGAADYLVDRGAPANLDRAIFGYNNSDRYVAAVQAHAAVLRRDPHRYHGYHAWDVVFLSKAGLVRLPEGYRQSEPVDAATWLAANPGSLVPGAT